MDVSSILTTLMSSSSINNIAKATEEDKSDVKSVISAALPKLLSSASKQSKDKSTAESFTDALAEHALTSTSNLSTFFKNIDLSDGTKIIKHLIGGTSSAETKEIASEAGVSSKTVTSVLSALGPLFMSLLGKSTNAAADSETTSSITKSITGMLKNVNVSSVLGSLLGTSTSSAKTTSASKKIASSSKTTSSAKKTTSAKKTNTSKKSSSSTADLVSKAGSLLSKLLK